MEITLLEDKIQKNKNVVKAPIYLKLDENFDYGACIADIMDKIREISNVVEVDCEYLDNNFREFFVYMKSTVNLLEDDYTELRSKIVGILDHGLSLVKYVEGRDRLIVEAQDLWDDVLNDLSNIEDSSDNTKKRASFAYDFTKFGWALSALKNNSSDTFFNHGEGDEFYGRLAESSCIQNLEILYLRFRISIERYSISSKENAFLKTEDLISYVNAKYPES